MAVYYDLPVYSATYQLIYNAFKNNQRLYEKYQYTLGQDMKRDPLQLMRIHRLCIDKW